MLLLEFDIHMLELVSDDHQSVATIRSSTEVPAGEAKVVDALFRLGRLGLVQSFNYDKKTRSYTTVPTPHEEEALSYWFLATESGRQHVEKHDERPFG